MITMIIDMPIHLGPDLTDQEWASTSQTHRQAKTEELQALGVTDERYAEVERAARGLWWSDVVGRIQ